ncbi:unnamed protein product [Vitrella brassicaformis CCMP3155]|uniref:J domain-containing protein n=2 Tax=Vitrella brassicaformis TaxID=1169539 RepID=A0A0G4F5V3_VITBC|nr:unnamed protein product [Vitrella brassicaformis CCMP3155]|eukprot:CEM07873.1 unnamed protein product [Vitrella brassicaformis CCMP3155]
MRQRKAARQRVASIAASQGVVAMNLLDMGRRSAAIEQMATTQAMRMGVDSMNRRPFFSSAEAAPSSDFLVCPYCEFRHTSFSFFCQGCGALQPSPEEAQVGHYELLDCDVGFDVDTARLSKTYKTLQQSLHPDKYAHKTKENVPDVQASADRASARVTEAYRTLLDPLKRAQYLLRKKFNISVLEEEQRVNDPELLEEVMEIQERLEEDPNTTQEDIEALKKDFDARVCKLVNTLSDHFRRADRQSLDESSIREAVERLQFYYRIKEELQQWKPK